MADLPFQPEEFLDATEARDSLAPRDAQDFDNLMNAIADLLNNKVMRRDGSIPSEDDQTFGGFSLLSVGDIVFDNDSGEPIARLHLNEAADPSELQIEFNSGTAENPVWEDTLAVELDASPQLLLQDNTGLKFPDGSQAHSDDFDGNGNVKLTTDQISNAIDYLASEYRLGDTDSDTNNWSWTENSDGHIEFSHAELPGSLLLKQDGTMGFNDQTGDPGADDLFTPRGYVNSITSTSTLENSTYIDGGNNLVSENIINTTSTGTETVGGASLVLLRVEALAFTSGDNAKIDLKLPSHNSYVTFAYSISDGSQTEEHNTFWYKLENENFDWRVEVNGSGSGTIDAIATV